MLPAGESFIGTHQERKSIFRVQGSRRIYKDQRKKSARKLRKTVSGTIALIAFWRQCFQVPGYELIETST